MITPIDIPVKASGTEKAERDLRGVEGALDSLAGGAGGVGQALRGLGPQAAVAVAGIAAIATAATAAAAAAVSLGQRLYELGMRGGDVAAVSAAFERLGSPTLLGRLHQATGGLVDDMTLMADATQALRTGIVSGGDLEEWFTVVARSAQDMNRDVATSLRSVTTALSGGGLETFNQLGVNVLVIRERLQAMGETAESNTGRVLALRMAMEQLRGNLGQVDNSSSNLNDAWTALGVSARNYYNEVAEGFATNQALVAFFVDLRETLEETAPAASEVANAMVELGVDLIEVTRAVVGAVSSMVSLAAAIERPDPRHATTTIGAIYDSLRLLLNTTEENDSALQHLDSALNGVDGALSSLDGPLARLRERMASGALAADAQAQSVDTLTAAYQRLTIQAADASDVLSEVLGQTIDENFDPQARGNRAVRESIAAGHPSNKRTRGGGGGGRSTQEQPPWWAVPEAEEYARRAREEQQGFYEDVMGYQDVITEGLTERWQFELRIQELLAQGYQEDKERFIEAERAKIEATQALADALKEQQDAARERTTAIVSDITQITGGVASLMQTIGSMVADNEQDAEKRKRIEGGFIIAYSSVMAAVELAESIKSFASQEYAAGAMHLLSMGAYIAAAAKAGSQLGGGSASAPAASYTPARSENANSRESKGEGSTYYINWTLSRSNAELGQVMERSEYERDRNQSRRQRPPGVRLE